MQKGRDLDQNSLTVGENGYLFHEKWTSPNGVQYQLYSVNTRCARHRTNHNWLLVGIKREYLMQRQKSVTIYSKELKRNINILVWQSPLFYDAYVEPGFLAFGKWNISEEEVNRRYSLQSERNRILIGVQSYLQEVMNEVFSVSLQQGNQRNRAKETVSDSDLQYESAMIREFALCLWDDITAVIGQSLMERDEIEMASAKLFKVAEDYRSKGIDDETINTLNSAPPAPKRENVLQDHIWGFYDTFGEMLIDKGVVSRCKNESCGKLFKYMSRYPTKAYCSPVFEGRNCRKAAANRRDYVKNRESRKEKARKEMKETRAFYKEKGVK